jgi:hypothetical protein
MELLPGFSTEGTRAFYRPRGRVSEGVLADLMTTAIRLARAQDMRDVVVNITGSTGFESPGPEYRRWVVERWANTAAGRLRVVVVARHEHICPNKTGLLVAAEQGLHAHICESEHEAVAWLDAAAAGDLVAPNPVE